MIATFNKQTRHYTADKGKPTQREASMVEVICTLYDPEAPAVPVMRLTLVNAQRLAVALKDSDPEFGITVAKVAAKVGATVATGNARITDVQEIAVD